MCMLFHYSKLDLVLRANGVGSKAIPERFQLRRAPFMATNLDEPLLDGSFNFNKITPEEVLLKIVPNESEEKHSLILANISPFAVLHCLFIPEPTSRFNQSTRVKENKPSYLELSEHPIHNFVIELTDVNNLNEFVNTIWDVVDACQSEKIAHNLFLSRVVNTCGNVRAVLWPRRSVFEPKAIGETANEQGYNLAVAELAGMYVVANEQVARRITPKELESSLLAERLSEDVIRRLEQRILRRN
ncbi:GDP-D-glucose phosphorylase [Paragonimus westermani]|uniref:GDP-D-glucose phosphorylase 1 n=1 Tax=Paragonimus westermani TaxID=34504 RepID=A0A5J4N760_9TREM|nr:GDP-D-glucose phosphorylase [Paragonimus westermani]